MNSLLFLKKHQKAFNIFASVFSWFSGGKKMFHRSTSIYSQGALLQHIKYELGGENNVLKIGSFARLNNCRFTLIGDNCQIIIGGGHTVISNTHFYCGGNNSKLIIGEDFTMQSGFIVAAEGKSVTIGDDCMFSDDVEIRSNDSHVVLDAQTNMRTNWPRSITIGNHVWLAAHTRILKGAIVPDNCIIANSAVVSHKLKISNAVYGSGENPLKECITWDRFITKYPALGQ